MRKRRVRIELPADPLLRETIRNVYLAMDKDTFPEVDLVASKIARYGADRDEIVATVNDSYKVIRCRSSAGFSLVFMEEIETERCTLVHIGPGIPTDTAAIVFGARALGIGVVSLRQ